jgi:hypothetical protein
MSRRRRRPSTPLAVLAGACLGLALAGALRVFVMVAAGGLALGLAAAVIQVRRYAAELDRRRARAARQHRPPVTIQPPPPPPGPADPGAALRATLRARADQVSKTVPAPRQTPGG